MRFVKTYPKTQGYFWIVTEDEMIIGWFLGDGYFSSCHEDGVSEWEDYMDMGWKRSAAEVKP
jgi:hypothetical protein